MRKPETSRLFSRWRNPETGVDSYVLTERPAPVQKSLYFTNRGYSDDGRYLWVDCSYPPYGGRYAAPLLAVVDFERDEMNVYHETQFSSASPMVDGGSGDVYWINGLDLWRRGPLAQDRPAWVNRFPADVANGRTPERVATHLTRSADGKCVGIDARFGGETYIGEMPLDGSPVSIWETSTSFYDHAQFSPTDPDVQMVALEYWQDHVHDAFDGRLPYNRLWTIKRGGRLDPVLNEPVSHSGHEWWDTDGKHIWYVHYGVGIKKVDLATRAETLLWPGHLAHGYSDAAGVFLVADMMADTVVCDCHVAFFNTTTGNAIDIVNTAPLPADVTQCTHLHPHPRFCLRDRYICHTTTVYGRVDMALVPTGPLIERTS